VPSALGIERRAVATRRSARRGGENRAVDGSLTQRIVKEPRLGQTGVVAERLPVELLEDEAQARAVLQGQVELLEWKARPYS
jgi:hypothetical protein